MDFKHCFLSYLKGKEFSETGTSFPEDGYCQIWNYHKNVPTKAVAVQALGLALNFQL